MEFFPPEINTIDALNKYLENRFDIGWNYLYLISLVKTESIKRILHKQFELDENTDIFTYIIDSVEYENNGVFKYLEGIDKFFAGFVCFNNRFFIFKEFSEERLESLEFRPSEEIKTEEDFNNFCNECLEAMHNKPFYCFYSEKINLMKDITELIDNPGRFFMQDGEREIYREISFESNKVQDPNMNELICKKLETLYSTSKETFKKHLENLQNTLNEISANTKSHDKI